MKQLNANRFAIASSIVAVTMTLVWGIFTSFGWYGMSGYGMHHTQNTMMVSGMWGAPILFWILQAALIGYLAGYAIIWIYNALSEK